MDMTSERYCLIYSESTREWWGPPGDGTAWCKDDAFLYTKSEAKDLLELENKERTVQLTDDVMLDPDPKAFTKAMRYRKVWLREENTTIRECLTAKAKELDHTLSSKEKHEVT